MYEWLQSFVQWLGDRFDGLERVFSGEVLWSYVLTELVPQLPESDHGLQELTDQAVYGISVLGRWISLADYFYNLPVLLATLGVIALVESGLLVVRLWRLVRSFIT